MHLGKVFSLGPYLRQFRLGSVLQAQVLKWTPLLKKFAELSQLT